jgi:hypothetical protein
MHTKKRERRVSLPAVAIAAPFFGFKTFPKLFFVGGWWDRCEVAQLSSAENRKG